MANKSPKKMAEMLLTLFAGGKRWIKNSEAKNKDGQPRPPQSYEAVSWCLVGGCKKLELPTDWLTKAIANYTIDPRRGTNEPSEGFTFIEAFNDYDGWTPVRTLLTRIKTHGIRAPKLPRINPKEIQLRERARAKARK